MEAVRALMENYWINKEEDRELYIKTKREIGSCRRFFTEQLGWRLMNNERVLKVEKIPAHAQSFMGITEFVEVRDYCIFCALLIFLEDKEDNEQFLLSEMVSMIEAQLEEFLEIDWTMFTQRKSLVRVLQFAEKRRLLEVFDGSSGEVSGGMEHEVLYENTGLSRYFTVNFGYGIADFTSYEDFEKEQIKELETDRGHFRINRVYRQLAAAPAMYWNSADNQDALYLKNQRQWVSKYMGENLGGTLQIHKNAAFFVMEEDDCFGEYHPRESTISEIVLNICGEIRERAQKGRLERGNDDGILISMEDFVKLLKACKTKYSAAWSKEYREMPQEKLLRAILSYMESWMLAKQQWGQVLIYPAAGKVIGHYPEEFLKKEKEKHE